VSVCREGAEPAGYVGGDARIGDSSSFTSRMIDRFGAQGVHFITITGSSPRELAVERHTADEPRGLVLALRTLARAIAAQLRHHPENPS